MAAKKKKARTKVTAALVAKVAKLKASGKTNDEIGEIMGLGLSTVSRWLQMAKESNGKKKKKYKKRGKKRAVRVGSNGSRFAAEPGDDLAARLVKVTAERDHLKKLNDFFYTEMM